jgi:hypothetical protein
MAYGYDAEQQLLSFAFAVIADEKSVANWGWFIQWVRKDVVGPSKITIISYQHLGIRSVFERLNFGWQESAGEVVHRYCTQHIAQNVYKDCHIIRINVFFQISYKTQEAMEVQEI